MTNDHFLETLVLLVGTAAIATGCRPARQSSEVPAAAPDTGAGQCLHAEGCCGGHTPGDASCGGETAAPTAEDDERGDAASAQAWTRTWTLAPGKMAEINLELGEGATMAASFSTDGGVLSWNVHSHEGDQAIIHAKGDDRAGRPEHTASKAGMYSFLWHNAGPAPVRLIVELELAGTARVHSTHPVE